jgi:hypothetical protein
MTLPSVQQSDLVLPLIARQRFKLWVILALAIFECEALLLIR